MPPTETSDRTEGVRIVVGPGPELLARTSDLLARAAARDPAPPLNEAAALALAHPDRDGAQHLVATLDGVLVGYGQLAPDGTGQVVVDPPHRRRGVGRALLEVLLEQAGRERVRLRVWALGDSPAARALAARTGLAAERTLLVMRRPLGEAAPLDAPVLPDGVVVQTFRVGVDEQAWLAVNARAFAHHPEQGSIDADALAERVAQPWFDQAGFFLARTTDDARVPGSPVLGFHWTKRHERGQHEGRLGEVYVLGVDPDAQGRGLAKALLLTGLAHLRDAGDEVVELYVEADQPGPVGLYTRYGFAVSSRDVGYAAPTDGLAGTTP